MANITVTELANHIPEITISAAQQGVNYLANYLNMARTVRKNFDPAFAKKGDVLNITKSGALSVNDKSANSDITLQTPSDDVVQLSLNKHKEVSFAIEDVAYAKSIDGVAEVYAKQAAQVIAETVEQSLADLYASAGTTLQLSDYSDWATALTAARRVLITNKVPKMAPIYGQIDQYGMETILNSLDKANEFGSQDPLVNALVYKLRGVNLFESQIVGIDTDTSPDTYYPLVYNEEAMMLAVRPLPDYGNGMGAEQATVVDEQTGLAMRATTSYDHNKLAMKMTLDVLYGVKEIRPELMVAISHQPTGVNA